MSRKKTSLISRETRATVRDTLILLGEFKVSLMLFTATLVSTALIYFGLAQDFHEPIESFPEALYLMLTLSFLQPSGEFPNQPVLQLFFFLMPLIGIATLAFGLTDFGISLFNRRARSKEWEMAIASTMNRHTILVGLGHLGYRVVSKLHEMEEDVVVIEINPEGDAFSAVQKIGVAVIQDDATRPAALEAAGIQRAKTIILCAQNDSMNLQIALKARSLNKNIKVVIRIFDEDFAQALNEQFGFMALSATGMAAPVFAAAATGADVTNPISVEGQQLSLARLTISARSRLGGMTVGQAEDHFHLSIVLVRQNHHSEMHPSDNVKLNAGNTIAVLGGPEQLNHLVHDNE